MNNGILERLVPCFVMLGTLTIIFGFIALMRYLGYKETLALAEKGLVKGQRLNGNGSGKDTLRWGIVITAVGLALCVGLYPIGFADGLNTQFPLGFGPWMLVGLIPTFFGLGLVLIYWLTHEEKKPSQDAPTQLPPE